MIREEMAGYCLSDQGRKTYRQYVLKGVFLPLQNIYYGTTGEMRRMKQEQLDRVLRKAIAESERVYVASYESCTACSYEPPLHPKAERPRESVCHNGTGMQLTQKRGKKGCSGICTLILCEPMYSQEQEDLLVSQYAQDWKELHVIQLVCKNTLEEAMLNKRKSVGTITQAVWQELLAQEVQKLEGTASRNSENTEPSPDADLAEPEQNEVPCEFPTDTPAAPAEPESNESPTLEGKPRSEIRKQQKDRRSPEPYLILAMAITIAASLLTPKTGAYALWNVLFSNLVVLTASLYGITVLYKKEGKGILLYGAAVLLLLLNIGINKDLALDTLQGPQTVILTNARYHSSSSPLIHIGTKYYLSGVDSEGQNLSVLLDGAHYQAETWEPGQTRVVKCYKHTGRLYSGPY